MHLQEYDPTRWRWRREKKVEEITELDRLMKGSSLMQRGVSLVVSQVKVGAEVT